MGTRCGTYDPLESVWAWEDAFRVVHSTESCDAVSSSGDFADIDREVERYKAFEQAGLTDLAIRVFDKPFEALDIIAERVVPHFS